MLGVWCGIYLGNPAALSQFRYLVHLCLSVTVSVCMHVGAHTNTHTSFLRRTQLPQNYHHKSHLNLRSNCDSLGLIVCRNLIHRLKTTHVNINLMSIYSVPSTVLETKKCKKNVLYESYSRRICDLADKIRQMQEIPESSIQ